MVADAMPDTHKISIAAKPISPFVTPITSFASEEISPISIKPPTRTNSPAKKKMVTHSTWANTSSISWSLLQLA